MESREKRRKKRSELSKRHSHASHQRMRIIAELAREKGETGLSGVRVLALNKCGVHETHDCIRQRSSLLIVFAGVEIHSERRHVLDCLSWMRAPSNDLSTVDTAQSNHGKKSSSSHSFADAPPFLVKRIHSSMDGCEVSLALAAACCSTSVSAKF